MTNPKDRTQQIREHRAEYPWKDRTGDEVDYLLQRVEELERQPAEAKLDALLLKKGFTMGETRAYERSSTLHDDGHSEESIPSPSPEGCAGGCSQTDATRCV